MTAKSLRAAALFLAVASILPSTIVAQSRATSAQNQEIRRLIGLFGSGDFEIAREASRAIETLGAAARIPLREALHSENAPTRLFAAATLARITPVPEEVVYDIAVRLGDPDIIVRREVDRIFTFSLHADRSRHTIPTLIEILDDPNQSGLARRYAAFVLLHQGPHARDAIPALMKAFTQDEDVSLRCVSLDAFGFIVASAQETIPADFTIALDTNVEPARFASATVTRTTTEFTIDPRAAEAIPILVSMLDEPSARCVLDDLLKYEVNGRLRTSVAEALRRIIPGASEYTKLVVTAWAHILEDDLVDSDRVDSEELEILRIAAASLGEIGRGDDDAYATLIKTAHYFDRRIRLEAVWALAKIGDPELVPAFVDLLDSDHWQVRVEAADALGRLGASTDGAVDALIDLLLADEDEEVRKHCATALIAMARREPPVILDMVSALRQGNGPSQRHIAVALGRVGREAQQALPDLRVLAESAETEVRDAARWAIGQIELGKSPP